MEMLLFMLSTINDIMVQPPVWLTFSRHWNEELILDKSYPFLLCLFLIVIVFFRKESF